MTARQLDPNGYMVVPDCPITREGIFDYSAEQLGLGGDPNRIVKVYRPGYAVQNPSFLNSIKSIPLIDDHTVLDGSEDAEATGGEAPEEVGIDGIVTDSVKFKAPWAVGTIKVFSRRMKRLFDQGKAELSLGYSCDFKMTPGTWNGEDYEVVQDTLFANHLALVDAARVTGARVLDCKIRATVGDSRGSLPMRAEYIISEVLHMPTQAKGAANRPTVRRSVGDAGTAVEQLKQQLQAMLPTLEAFLSQEAGEPAHQEAAPAAPAAPAEQAAPAPAAAAQPEVNDDGGAGDLISTLEAILAQLKGGEQAAAPAAQAQPEQAEIEASPAAPAEPATPANEPEDNPAADSVNGLQEGGEHSVSVDAEAGVPEEKPNAAAGDEGETEMENKSMDQEAGFSGANGKVSEGPKAGVNTNAQAGDAAIRAVRADIAKAGKLYERLSTVVGAFDSAEMTHKDMAAYGCKKLGLNIVKGHEYALDAYLAGVEKTRTVNVQTAAKIVGDSASSMTSEMSAYLSGAK